MPGSHADSRGPFVGRAAQLEAVDAAFAAPGVLTLLGPGGVGKTRLAREIVRRWSDKLEPILVWLDELDSDDEVGAHVARALGITPTDEDLAARIAEWCEQAAPTLLVVDNAEHVLAGARDLIAQLPPSNLRVLVTSRVPLELPNEARIRLDQLEPADAHDLLVGRLALHELAVPDVDMAPLLHALDHLPLAIELVAPRFAIMSPDQILRRLEASNDVVGSYATSRHGTLDRTIGWSWDLLDEAERDIAYTVAHFEQPVGPDLVVGCWPEHDVYSIAQALLDKSWLRAVESDDGKRWTTLWAMRRFVESVVSAEERADFDGRLRGWAAQHLDESPGWWASHVPGALEAAASMSAQGDFADAAQLMTRSYFGAFGGPHFTRALDQGVALLEAWDSGQDPERWSGLASRVAKGFFRQARPRGATDWSERAFAVAPAGSATRLDAGAQFVLCLMDDGRRDEAEPLLEALNVERRSLPHDVSLASGLLDLATSAHEMGRFELTRSICDDVMAAAELAASPNVAARTWIHLSYVSYDLGEYERARFEVEQLELLIGERHPHERLSIGGAIPAMVQLQLGNPETARASLLERAALARQTRYHAMEFFVCLGLAEWAARHAPEEIPDHLRRASVLARMSGSAKSIAQVGWAEAVEQVVAGRFDAALARLAALREGPEPGDREAWLDTLDALQWFCRATTGDVAEVTTTRGRLFEAAHHAIVRRDSRVLEQFLASQSAAHWNVPGVYMLRLEDVARRLVRDAMETAPSHRLELDREGRKFRLDDAAVTDISRRGALRRILVCLAKASAERPGNPVTTDDVIDAGWPDEQILYDAALSRVYTTMNRLRSLGFEPWIHTLDDGYVLDPTLTVEWVDGFESESGSV